MHFSSGEFNCQRANNVLTISAQVHVFCFDSPAHTLNLCIFSKNRLQSCAVCALFASNISLQIDYLHSAQPPSSIVYFICVTVIKSSRLIQQLLESSHRRQWPIRNTIMREELRVCSNKWIQRLIAEEMIKGVCKRLPSYIRIQILNSRWRLFSGAASLSFVT